MPQQFSLLPIDFIDINNFSPINAWNILSGAPVTLYFVLTITDAFGTRRYIPQAGTTVKIAITRARPVGVGSLATNIIKTAVQIAPTDDKSLYSVDLTASDSSLFVTGGVQLIMSRLGIDKIYPVPYVIKKINNSAGC